MSKGQDRQGLYTDPVLYDILNTPGTAAEVNVLERLERRFAPTRGLAADRLWLEPACGTGRYLRVAARRGRRCVGFDVDPLLLAYARSRKAPAGFLAPHYHQADMTGFAAECGLAPASVDFAFNPVNSLRHLASDRALLAHFAEMARVLKPGAVYAVGISLTDYQWLQEEEDLWEGTRGACRVSQLVNYLPPEPGTPRGRTETVISHLTVTRPGSVTHLDDTYDLRSYDAGQWRGIVGRSDLVQRGSFDAFGKPLLGRVLPYQWEVLGPST